ncbi:MAG: YigZ family protein [Ignavibacteriaceae bacterium]|nr:YigZ family protein [Ignavibacteriaceae bacterium]HRN24978.1 YigZ family protein [Ignavibacteriaceae bacterium]HRP93584.1 YigZ family protein [Ignavibacteriaceae bacterium]HRQ52642.1 YigZ family protein [Ignavibacteriaceae bacterium]
MLPDQIKTVKNFQTSSLKEKGSEFLATVYPIDSDESALDRLNEIKKKYYDATHHCYAYKLKNGETKYSDDGEPNGTAGIRILNAIEHFDLNDVLVIVVRYFGGTKLGVGPLGKAYYNASIDVLNVSEIVLQTLYQKLWIEVDFSFISHVHRVINHYSAIVADSEYSNNAKFICWIKSKDQEKIDTELTNLTNGQVLIKLLPDLKYF